jgi:hypothetical protein
MDRLLPPAATMQRISSGKRLLIASTSPFSPCYSVTRGKTPDRTRIDPWFLGDGLTG